MLRVEKLSVSYWGIRALRGVSIDVKKGEVVTVIGANGAGKTTLLKGILGLVRADEGRIFFKGEDITRFPPWERVKRGIAYIPEGRRIFPYLTVLENLYVGAHVVKDKNTLQNRLEMTFNLFPTLKERRTQIAKTLSGGESQMLAVGRGLMSVPELLLLDEPSLGLSPILVEAVFKKIKELKEMGITLLLVEQNVKKALEVADRCYVLELGAVSLSGSAKEIMDSPDVKRAYLGV